MNTLTRLAALSLFALMSSTSLTLAVNLIDKPVLVDVYEPPIDVDVTPNPPVDDHNLNDDLFDNGPIDDHDLTDAIIDKDDADTADAGLVLTCTIVAGELVITNAGGKIPAGAKVKWQAAGQHGTVLLPNGLNAGQKAKIDVTLGADTGKCTADVVL